MNININININIYIHFGSSLLADVLWDVEWRCLYSY